MRHLRSFFAVLVLLSVAPAQQQQAKLSAPTYYLAARVKGCSAENIDVVGASNLPKGAVLQVQVTRFFHNAWADFSDPAYSTVNEKGYFSATLRPKQKMRFFNNLVVRVTFAPFFRGQPQEVLKVVGRRGQKLGDWNNPQLGQVSGPYFLIETIDRVNSCEGPTLADLPVVSQSKRDN